MRRTWLEKLETAGIVTVIAVLVWLYAEGESVRTYPNQRLRVRFVPPAGQELAIEPDQVHEVLVTVRGSTGEMGRLEALQRRGPIPIEVGVDPENPTPEQVIVYRDRLLQTPLGDVGLNITGTTPDTQTVRVEQLVTQKLPVVPSETSVVFAKPPVVEPREVEVALRSSLADAAEGERVIADLSAVDFNAFEVNTPQTIEVPLIVPFTLRDDATSLAQETARVTFTVRNLTDSYTVPIVKVWVKAGPLTLEQYQIDVAESDVLLRDVEIRGPSDAIDRIRRGEITVEAVLTVGSEDAERGTRAIPPTVQVPAGVVAEPVNPIPVRITPR